MMTRSSHFSPPVPSSFVRMTLSHVRIHIHNRSHRFCPNLIHTPTPSHTHTHQACCAVSWRRSSKPWTMCRSLESKYYASVNLFGLYSILTDISKRLNCSVLPSVTYSRTLLMDCLIEMFMFARFVSQMWSILVKKKQVSGETIIAHLFRGYKKEYKLTVSPALVGVPLLLSERRIVTFTSPRLEAKAELYETDLQLHFGMHWQHPSHLLA